MASGVLGIQKYKYMPPARARLNMELKEIQASIPFHP